MWKIKTWMINEDKRQRQTFLLNICPWHPFDSTHCSFRPFIHLLWFPMCWEIFDQEPIVILSEKKTNGIEASAITFIPKAGKTSPSQHFLCSSIANGWTSPTWMSPSIWRPQIIIISTKPLYVLHNSTNLVWSSMRHYISHVHACGKLSTIRPGHNQCGLLPVQRYIETSYQEYALTQSRLIQLQILHRRICLAKAQQ